MRRFVVRELDGYLRLGGRESGNSTGLSVTVCDSAYCFEVVRTWRTEALWGTWLSRQARRDRCRREARALAAELNADDALAA